MVKFAVLVTTLSGQILRDFFKVKKHRIMVVKVIYPFLMKFRCILGKLGLKVGTFHAGLEPKYPIKSVY